jgi:hypothetical protein
MAKQWYQKNLRFLQTVLREPDIIDYDAKGVVAYMKKANANCLVLNAGGVIDFFENPLEMANENRFRNGQNMLGDICKEIHAAGMKIIVRVDFRGVEDRRYKLHPDWFAVDQDGNSKVGQRSPDSTRITTPCYNSYYTSGHAVEFIRHLMSNYDIDGIWENALGFDNMPCYCNNCRQRYLKDTGKQMPLIPEGMSKLAAMDLPEFIEYRAWKAGCADEHIERLRKTVKEYGEDKAFCAEIFDMYSNSFSKATGIDHSNARKSFDFIVSCVFLNSNGSPSSSRVYDILSSSASTIRFSRALDATMQPVIVTGGNGTRWRYTCDPQLETRLWMWEIVSVGGGIWNCYFNGQHPAATHDLRNAYSEQDAYTYLADNSEIISDTKPVQDVALFYSNVSRDRFADHDEHIDQFGVCHQGMERVLLENHVQYNFIPDSNFTLEALKNVKALVLPNVALISDAHIEIIREYVKNGGGLIATYNTSLYNEKGEPRTDFGLGDLFGVSSTGTYMDTRNDCYQLVANKNSPVLDGIGDTEVLINGETTLLCVKTNKNYDTISTYIPMLPNQPPEYSWQPDLKTDYPIIISGEYGKGKVVYFSNRADAQCFLHGHEDYTEIMKNAVDYVTGKKYTLTSDALRSIHVNAVAGLDDPGSMVISFVNTTGAQQRPIKEVAPVYDFSAKVPLNGRKLASSSVLWGGEQVSVTQENDDVVIHIAKIDEFVSVAIQLA